MDPIEFLTPPVSQDAFDELCTLFADAITHGASMGYMLPLDHKAIAAFWSRVIGEAGSGNRLIALARDAASGAIIGSAQLAIETRPNGLHRAEVQKLMVLHRCRRQGLGTRLMHTLEDAAARRGLTLLFLDTSEGPGGAQPLYERLGYTYAGGIPGYALDPDGTPAKNAIYFKVLPPPVDRIREVQRRDVTGLA